ncbi:MAG: type IV secretion system protein [Synergistaceae bacterium]|jgi:type IV secretory pathway TrbF-like protein|nr:type IV secretion system protein [Synergistaceae bacterium]
MSLFGKKGKNDTGNQNAKKEISQEADEKKRQEVAENNPWMKAKKRHIDVYQELAFSVAQWRLLSFVLMILLALSVLCNFSLAKSVKIQPYVIQVDEHGYAIPVSEVTAANVDARIVSAQIASFIINSRARLRDMAAQLVYSENSFKSVAAESSAAAQLNNYYRESPPTGAKYPVSINILTIKPMAGSGKIYEASWTETVMVGQDQDQKFGFIGTFEVAVSPPSEYAALIDNPLGVYITDFNIIRNY